MIELHTNPEIGPEDFWRAASQNVLLAERADPDLVIGLAHGGILPARATQVAWEELLHRPFPPLLLTNIGSEKRRRYDRHGGDGFDFHGTFSSCDEVVHFLQWLHEQKDWQEELQGQIAEVLGSQNAPQSIIVIDEMISEGFTMLLTLGLLEILYPYSKTDFLDGPYFAWRTTMSRRWLHTFHPHLLTEFDQSNREIPWERMHAPYAIAAGTEDIDPEMLGLRPLSPANPHLSPLMPFLPTEEWMHMPDWITQTVLTHVAEQAALTDLESVRQQNAYILEREWNGLGIYLLLGHIRHWGSITVGEASQLLDIRSEAAQNLLDWLVERVENDARWQGTSPLTQARIHHGRVYFAQDDEDIEQFAPAVRRGLQQKQRSRTQRYQGRRRFPLQ